MATETVSTIIKNQSGGLKTRFLTFTTTGTTNEFYTGLRRVKTASIAQVTGTADNNVKLNINSKTADTDNDGNDGWVHFVGAANTSVYQVCVEGY